MHQFIEKTSGKEVDYRTVRDLVKRVIDDSHGHMARLDAAMFVANMFEQTGLMLVLQAVDKAAKEDATGHAMMGKLSESKIRPRRLTEAARDQFGQGKGRLNPDHAGAIPNASWYPTADAYAHYRMLVAVASLPDEPQFAADSPVQDHPFSSAYTDAEFDMLEKAAKLCGHTPKILSDRYSTEQDSIHRISPTNHNGGKHR